ncbi:hypothetical protein H6G33_09470 [Calothrix sp. FACHB-1219]|uniref:hypothetical protein n=1 Tax=unclassified Calothrix TaxID=2619626 RepID=UPI001689232D|nr:MULTISPECIES: hypothetical protein [unclassified Calothrix]MBD2201575.1 hypothetical protein [Calothrix sp. FACHB-168]MBD2217261.1 hypothetical protein [Calothrix sp. FACHB-1219]
MITIDISLIYREDNDNYRYKSYLYEDVNNEGGHIRLTIVETIDDDGEIVDRESTLTEE